MMRKVLPIRIHDWDFVLSDLDRHQIENLVWLSVSPFRKEVKSIAFEVVEFYCRELGKGYRMTCRTETSGGNVLKTEVLGAKKRELILHFGQQFRSDLQQRVRYESGFAFRTLKWFGERVCRIRNAFGTKSQQRACRYLNHSG